MILCRRLGLVVRCVARWWVIDSFFVAALSTEGLDSRPVCTTSFLLRVEEEQLEIIIESIVMVSEVMSFEDRREHSLGAAQGLKLATNST